MEKTDIMASPVEKTAAKEPQKNVARGETATGIKRRKWRREEERILITMYDANEDYAVIGQRINRTVSAVTSRLQRMGYLMYDKENKTMIRIK
ncbi:MAG: hypothetical protein MJZ79_07430 [Paludibacteraceae bacterium]|nr:hypothetical protein [Paludibacteraceae bacterium]